MENKKFKWRLENKILKSWLLNAVVTILLIILFLLIYRVEALTEYKLIFSSALAIFLIGINLGLRWFWKRVL